MALKRRRRSLRGPGGTEALGVAGVGLTVGATALEWLHLRRLAAQRQAVGARPREPRAGAHDRPAFASGADLPPSEEPLRLFEHPLDAGAEAARDAVAVVRSGYETGSRTENATLNLLLSYALTAGIARSTTHVIRARGSLGPIRNRSVGGRHIHHFVPGILLVFVGGAASIISRDEGLDPWLALPFGAGMALVLDEAALLVDLEDVYWTERGVLSVQLTLGTMAGLGALAVVGRVVRRGEQVVLDDA